MSAKKIILFAALAVILFFIAYAAGSWWKIQKIMTQEAKRAAFFAPPQEVLTDELQILSPAFKNNYFIPEEYTCRGQNINPSLLIRNVPSGAKSLALIVEDPDAAEGLFTHWLVWDIKPRTIKLDKNSVPEGSAQGRTDFGENKYGGPCPSAGVHRYFFKLYALDTVLDLPAETKRDKFLEATQGHIIAQDDVVGLFGR